MCYKIVAMGQRLWVGVGWGGVGWGGEGGWGMGSNIYPIGILALPVMTSLAVWKRRSSSQ